MRLSGVKRILKLTLGVLLFKMATDMHPRENCWVCRSADTLHEHHVIPRAFGGTNGPLCTLCSSCHGIIHKAAVNRDYSTNQIDTVVSLAGSIGTNVDFVTRLCYLTNIIFKSGMAVKNDENKTITFSTKLEPEYAKMLKKISQKYGVSQQVAMRLALKHFSMTC